MINFTIFGRMLFGIAFLIYGYLHFAYTAVDITMVPDGVGTKIFWVYLVGACWWAVALSFFTNIMTRLSGILAAVLLLVIFFFTVVPNFNGMSSWASTASIIGMIAGSLLVAGNGGKWTYKKVKR